MCLASPGKVLEVAFDEAGARIGRTNFGGVIKEVSLEYTPDVVVGDYVLVHVGVALGKVDEAEAQRTYKILEEFGQLEELTPPDIDALAKARGELP
ncbi:MAG: HypC/HybG/HupF family hydrogenase formation chaperone [Verrucomicrobiota bacterium]